MSTPNQSHHTSFVGITSFEINHQKFGIRRDSVKEHVNNILDKIGAANRTEAVAIALKKHRLKM